MEKIYELIEKIADACYSDSRDIAQEEIRNLVDLLISENSMNDSSLFLLNQINTALESNDYITIADYLIYGLKNIISGKPVPDCVFYPYTELIPETEEEVFYLPSFMDKEPVLCMKSNGKTIRFNSEFSPVNEVKYYVDHIKLRKYTPAICIFGIGTGLMVERILGKLSGEAKVIIYEPEKKLIEYCKNSALVPDCLQEEKLVYERINRIINDERVSLFIEEDHKTSFQVILDSNIDYIGIAGLVHFINSGYAEVYSSSCVKFYRELEEFRVRLLANKNTELRFVDEYINYSFRNLPLCKKINLASELKNIVPENIPCIIVSAGPSLNKNIEELRKVKGHFFIVAVDTALQFLMKRDIIPDLWVTIDPQKPLDYFKDERSYDIPCVFKSTANSDVLGRVNRVFLLDGEREYLQLLIGSLGVALSEQYGTGGSVATTSFAFLYSIGIKNIIMIGQDLAYLGEVSHADGVNDGADLETAIVEGIDGKPVKTRFDWLNYLKWFENAVEMFNANNLNISVIDSTEGGVKIHGTKIMTLNEAINSFRNADGLLPEFDFEAEVKNLPYLFDEQGYKALCEQHKKNIRKIREIETDAYSAHKMCDQLINQIKAGNASDTYIRKQNKTITAIRERIEDSSIFYIINRYAQNYTMEKRVQLELEDGNRKETQINLVKILMLTFDSYIEASKKVYDIAKEYEKEL